MKSALRRNVVLKKPVDLGRSLRSDATADWGAVSWLDAALWTETVIEFDAPAAAGEGVRFEIEYLAKGKAWALIQPEKGEASQGYLRHDSGSPY